MILDTFIKTCQETQNLVTSGQKYRALYMKTYAQFIIVDDIKSPQKLF